MASLDEPDFQRSHIGASATSLPTNLNLLGVLPPFSKKLPRDPKLKLNPEKFEENISNWKENIALSSLPIYPTPHIFAQIASVVYTDYKNRESPQCYEKRLKLPTGWKLLTTAKGQNNNGYFGAAFYHTENRQVIIAHRGTKLTIGLFVNEIITDIEGIVFNNYVAQMSSAVTFTDKVVETLRKLNKERIIDYDLFFTGHSLGGWLAQVTTLTTEYMCLDGEFFERTKQPKPSQYHAHTVVFDSPGCANMLLQIISDFDVRYGDLSIDINTLDITSYLSAPNRINTCNPHVGKIYRILTDLSKITWLQKCTYRFNFVAHCMEKILQEFDQITGDVHRDESGHLKLREVVDWPISGFLNGGEEYKSLFVWANHQNNFHPDIFEKELTIPAEVGYHRIRYQTKLIDEKSCSLSVFTVAERQFLDHYRRLRKLPEFFKPEELFKTSDTTFWEPLHDFKINKNSISSSKTDTLQKVIPYVKHLLRQFPDISKNAEKMLSSEEIQRKFFKLKTTNHLHEANQMPIEPQDDNLGLENFLNHEELKIWLQTVYEETSLVLTWTYKIFQNKKQKTLFVNEDQFTVLKLKQQSSIHQIMADVQVLFEIRPHLLIIECKILDYGAKHLLKSLFSKVQNETNIKLIIIASTDQEIDKFLQQEIANSKNYITTSFPQLEWNDLTEMSQKALMRVRSLLRGVPVPFDNSPPVNLKQHNQLRSSVVGQRPIRWGDLPAAYTKQLVNIEAINLLSALMSAKNTKTMFVINGLNSTEELMQSLNLTPESEEVLILADRVSQKFTVGKNIIIISGDYSEQDFKCFCNDYSTMKVHWLTVTAKEWQWNMFYDPDFYVERTFKKVAVNSVIKQRLLSNSPDKFVFCGLPSEESIWQILDITEVNEEAQLKMSSNVILEQSPNDSQIKWNDLGNNSTTSIYLLKVEREFSKEQLLWQRLYPGETPTFLGNFTLPENEPLVIIVDEPGMGKSTTLTWIAKQRRDGLRIINLNLKNCRQQLTYLPMESPSMSQLSGFLWNGKQKSEDTLTENDFFNHLTTTKDTSFQLLILLDGFDEISHEEQQKIVSLLRVLRDAIRYSKHQVIVTTRRHPELEKHLELPFILQFYGFRRPQQKKFIQDFWRKSTELILNAKTAQHFDTKSEIFIDTLLMHVDNTLGKETARFTSIPLQLRLLAGVFQEEFLKFLTSDRTFPCNTETLRMAAICQRYIAVKYQLYFKEQSNLRNESRPIPKNWLHRTLEKFHQQLAVQTLFLDKSPIHEEMPTFWKKKLPSTDELEEIYRVGLVQKDHNNDHFEFVHPTFAEFYFSDLLFDQFQKDTENSNSKSVQNFLFEYILLEPSFRVIRLFLNDRMGDIYSEKQLRAFGLRIKDLWSFDKLRDRKGNTVLHIACKENNVEIVRFLLKALADQQATRKSFLDYETHLLKRTPLHYAASWGNRLSVKALLAQGAEVDPRDAYGMTPLIGAADKGHESVVKVLLKRWANVDAKTYEGMTALHYAAYRGYKSIVKTLLENGANVKATVGRDKRCAVFFANANGHASVVQVLQSKVPPFTL